MHAVACFDCAIALFLGAVALGARSVLLHVAALCVGVCYALCVALFLGAIALGARHVLLHVMAFCVGCYCPGVLHVFVLSHVVFAACGACVAAVAGARCAADVLVHVTLVHVTFAEGQRVRAAVGVGTFKTQHAPHPQALAREYPFGKLRVVSTMGRCTTLSDSSTLVDATC